jgi:diguanylate cyclase (GGDEF)-like protein
MTPGPDLLAPARAAVGTAPDVRRRLRQQRPRPLLIALYAALFGEAGLAGPPARRRAYRLAVQSVPAAAGAIFAVLLVMRFFVPPALGWPQVLAGAVLLAVLGAAVWRCAVAVAAGRRTTLREGLELGVLALVTSLTLAQIAEAAGAAGAASLQPLVYLVLAALVALLPNPAGAGLVIFTLLIDAALWWARGATARELPGVVVRAAFTGLFALLYHGVLGARIAAGRRAEEAALERRKRELDERARQLRLLAAGEAGADEGDRHERVQRLIEAAVLETDSAAKGLLEVVEGALGAHTVAVWLLSEDDAELRLWEHRSRSDRVAARLPAGEGPLGGVVKRRAPVRLHGNIRAANHYDDGLRPKAMLVVPLLSRVGGHVRGVVLADRLEPAVFTDDHERLLARIASELARAAAAERLIRDSRARRDEKERFYQAIERLNRLTTPREVFDAVLDAAGEMAPVDFGAVTLFEEGSNGAALHRVARARLAKGPDGGVDPRAAGFERLASELEGKEFPDNGGLVACAVRLASSLPGRELKLADAVVFDEATRLKGFVSLKVLPLRTGESVLGTLVVGSRRSGAYQGDVVRQLEVVALQAGDSLLRARLFETTQRLATTDGLTGLLNHRTFQTRVDDHLAAAQRYGKKLSLLLTDVDHFKSVNDTYGHPVGDLVLRGVAKILQTEARTTDVVARYGGEEFAVVMPETDLAGALRTAERIREKVAQTLFQTDQGELKVTISIGVATFPDDGDAKAQIIELADGGLYHAKRTGRNRTVALSQVRGRRRAS